MSEFSKNDPIKEATEEWLRARMSQDVKGWEEVAKPMLMGKIGEALKLKPDWPYQEELNGLLRPKEKRTSEQEARLDQLLSDLGISPEQLKAEIMAAYAEKNNLNMKEEEKKENEQ